VKYLQELFMAIAVAIVEDVCETRENLIALLREEEGLSLLNAYANAEDAVRGIPIDRPNVALVDIRLPHMSGIDCVAKLKAQMPELEVLMVTTYEEPDLIFNSLRAGAKGYVLKSAPPEELIQAIRQVHAGGAPMSMQIARKVVDYFTIRGRVAPETDALSPREQEVLTLLAEGFLYKEISDKLDINVTTVRTHLRRIYEKLHVRSRTEATAKFLQRF
jgi:DNA-binding NarL/FixJ family response regulator